MGRFFVANTSTAWLQSVLNEGALPPGRPCSEGPEPPRYTPYFVTARLARYPQEGALSYGENRLASTFADGITPRQGFTFPITLPDAHSLDDDVISFAFRGWLLLTDSRGSALPPNPLVIPGVPSTASTCSQAPTNQGP